MDVFQGRLVLGMLLFGCAKPQADSHIAGSTASRPTIVFMTGFGTANDAVAICKAVMIGIAPDARIMDITHQVTPYFIEEVAHFPNSVTPYYPAGTVFVAVIDPGVGTSRKAVIVKTKKRQYFVAPDNGLISPVLDRDGLDSAREVTNPAWMIGDNVSSTFHGRDIFSPTAAHLVAGWDYTLARPAVSQLVRLIPKVATVTDRGIAGEVIALDDPFGSLITEIQGADFKKLGCTLGDKIAIQLNKNPFTVPYMKTFMDVPVSESLLYQDSLGRVALAMNQGNFSQVHKIMPTVSTLFRKKLAA
jgi:S-adenosylmethionine hydrolase